MGRPRKTLPKNGLELISDLSARGVKETEIAKALGMSFQTWKKIREENPEAKQAWEEAKAVECDALVGKLYDKAMDGDSSAAMFLLKARHGYRDHGATDASDASRVNLVFNLPAPLSPDQYGKLVEVHRDTLPKPEQ